jgi:hypothetical protein
VGDREPARPADQAPPRAHRDPSPAHATLAGSVRKRLSAPPARS